MRFGDELRAQAVRHAGRVLDQFGRSDFDLVDLLCGLALELAVKARLADEHPLLLAPSHARWFEAGIALMSANPERVRSARTVGAVDALDRLVKLHPQLARVRDDAKFFFDRRNAVAHLLGPNERHNAEQHLARFVITIEAILPSLDWGPANELTAKLRSADVNRRELELQMRRANARTHLEDLIRQGTLELHRQNASLHADNAASDPTTMRWSCDVCGSPGTLLGELDDFGEPEYERDADGFVDVTWSPLIVFLPKWYSCSVCGVTYFPWDIERLGVDNAIRVDVDPATAYDVMRAEEPDDER